MARGLVVAILLTSWVPAVSAHSGPPYPVISDRVIGPYVLSIWTDPDATDDGSAAGQFWVIVRPAAQGTKLPDDTQVIVAVAPIDRDGEAHRGVALSVDGDPFRRFIALPLEHEGMFAAAATVTGALGNGSVETTVSGVGELACSWGFAKTILRERGGCPVSSVRFRN